MAEHDPSYKLLFSHPRMVRDLLEGFVRQDWLTGLDYGSLEPVKGSYVSDDLRRRASDVVWRVRWGREWLYIYLLIEFQSSPERFMALRMTAYVALLYQDLLRARRLGADRQLPPLLPIVLYNGEAPWNAPVDVTALIQPGPSALDAYRLQGRYLLIDERRCAEREPLPLRNLVAAMVWLENGGSPEDIRSVLRSLAQWLKAPGQEELDRAFSVWINRVILARLPDGPLAHAEDLHTMSTLFEARFQKWVEETRLKGHEEGRREGHQEGRQEGEARLLHRQLRRRFGELPPWVWPRLQQAQPEQLERWGERLLDVSSLEAVFDDA